MTLNRANESTDKRGSDVCVSGVGCNPACVVFIFGWCLFSASVFACVSICRCVSTSPAALALPEPFVFLLCAFESVVVSLCCVFIYSHRRGQDGPVPILSYGMVLRSGVATEATQVRFSFVWWGLVAEGL